MHARSDIQIGLKTGGEERQSSILEQFADLPDVQPSDGSVAKKKPLISTGVAMAIIVR